LTPPLWRPDADGGCGFEARLLYMGGGVREIEDGAKFVVGQGAGFAQLLERGDGLTDRPADAYASEQGTLGQPCLLL
jgi:hypothetical protein